jgi:uncharacterized NAD-dependent epimerase/dehydratase family protein
MSNDKMREEFEAAFVEEMVFRCGEGYRSSVLFFFVEKEPDGGYSHPIAHAGWWAWQASRAAVVVELPEHYCYDSPGEAYPVIQDCREAIEAVGLKVAS